MSATPHQVPALSAVTIHTERFEGHETIRVVDAPEWTLFSLEVLMESAGNRVAIHNGDRVVIMAAEGDYVYKIVGWSRIDRGLICRLERRP